MAEDFIVLRDLQSHLRTAQVPFEQLSTLAKQGDDKQAQRQHWALDIDDFKIHDEHLTLLIVNQMKYNPLSHHTMHLATSCYNQGDKLVEKFLSENIKVEGSGTEVMQSQLYIACFWGIREVVQQLLEKQCNPNSQNKGSLWTPLHAASFQEHGPIVMLLLEHGAQPELPDSEGRTPKDFASASDKIWPHFHVMGLSRTPKWELVEKGVIKKLPESMSGPYLKQNGQGIRMAADSRPESVYAYNSDPFIHAAVTGDVLADQDEAQMTTGQPQFSLWR